MPTGVLGSWVLFSFLYSIASRCCLLLRLHALFCIQHIATTATLLSLEGCFYCSVLLSRAPLYSPALSPAPLALRVKSRQGYTPCAFSTRGRVRDLSQQCIDAA